MRGGKKCMLCGTAFSFGEVYLFDGKRLVCLECADGAGGEELVRLSGAGDNRGLLAALGFQKDFI